MWIYAYAIYFGVFTIIIGLMMHVLLGYHAKHADSPYMVQEMIDLVVLLFLTGTFSYLLYQKVGLDQYKAPPTRKG